VPSQYSFTAVKMTSLAFFFCHWTILVLVAVATFQTREVICYSIQNNKRRVQSESRRECLQQAIILSVTTILSPQEAVAEVTVKTISNPMDTLIEARETLDTLLKNYKRATVDCTYADVPRDLLESKNKELLLEKASTFALFDKSVSVESCKTTNRIVRDYLGVTGKVRH
jgi:hypothetical protein